ncbi:MAG TPA: hypothetical protein DEG71_03255 [Clostridiales bacterium]|nr:hypothetical protein [Clostridiales bacterium]
MNYKGFNIIIEHHEPNIMSKSITNRVLDRYGSPAKRVFQQDNINIWRKTTNGYHRGAPGIKSHRLIYLAENGNSGIEVYVKYNPNQKLLSDVEIMVKKVLCQKVLETYGIKLTK